MPKPEDRVQWLIKKLLPGPIKKRAMNAWKLATAQTVVVSFPKSGRTWLRAALTFYLAERYGLDDPPLLEFANLHYLDGRIPKIFFTHDGDSRSRPEQLSRDKSMYKDKRVLFLVRDPRDVCVSMYFHRQHRYRESKLPIYQFAESADGGLRTTVEFMNIWADALAEIPQSLCVAYEGMHAEPEKTFSEILRFIGEDPKPELIDKALVRARFDRLQAMERGAHFESGRLTPADSDDENSFKVRSGKVGGYADYFDSDEKRALDTIVDKELSSFFNELLSRPQKTVENAEAAGRPA